MSNLIENLINAGYIKTPRIIKAFRQVPRFEFLPRERVDKTVRQAEAEINAPLSLGCGQTISQPLTVALMLEMLGPRPGEKILDVGAGSGWQACLLAHVVRPRGRVWALEIIPELKNFGEQNAQRLGFKNIHFILGNGWQGYKKAAPFDRIIVAAAAPEIPAALKQQLKVGGVMVIPVGATDHCTMTRLEKLSADDFEITEEPGFAFVPLVQKRKV